MPKMDDSKAVPRTPQRRGWLRPVATLFLASFSRGERIGIAITLGLFIAIHSILIVPQFGEDDQARFANEAAEWHLSGRINFQTTDYRLRTSPLYLHAGKVLLDFGLPIQSLPSVMNGVNLATSAAFLLFAYLLFRPLVDRGTAGLACSILAFTPAAWLGASYGMAHVPALCFWLLSLLAYSAALDQSKRRPFYGLCVLALASATIALGFKADVILTGLAFPGLALVKKRFSLRTVSIACSVVVVALSVQVLYSKSLIGSDAMEVRPEQHQSLAEWAETWHSRFPFDTRGLTEPKHLSAITNSSGPFFFALALFGLAVHAVSPGRRRLAIWAFAWSAPLMLFWGLIIGNSARHNLAALPPLMLLVSSTFARLTNTRVQLLALTGAMICVNYFSDTKGQAHGHGTMVPRTDLLTLSSHVNRESSSQRKRARRFANLKDDKRAAIERHLLSHVEFEFLAAAHKVGRLEYDGKVFRVLQPDGQSQLVRFAYAGSRSAARRVARELRRDGYAVYSVEHRL